MNRGGGTVPNPNVTNVTRQRSFWDRNISGEMWLNQMVKTENFLSQLLQHTVTVVYPQFGEKNIDRICSCAILNTGIALLHSQSPYRQSLACEHRLKKSKQRGADWICE